MARPSRFSPEVRDRAVRMVLEHANEHASQGAAITSIAEKRGGAAETLRSWVRQAQRDQGQRPGLTTEERQVMRDPSTGARLTGSLLSAAGAHAAVGQNPALPEQALAAVRVGDVAAAVCGCARLLGGVVTVQSPSFRTLPRAPQGYEHGRVEAGRGGFSESEWDQRDPRASR
jgi:transposase-like protein